MAQILTYPYGVAYQESGWADQVKQGSNNNSIPCWEQFYEGSHNVTTNGEEWSGSSGAGSTQGNFSQPLYHPFNQDWGGTGQSGLHYSITTSSNNREYRRWYDIGAETNRNHGVDMRGGARSSWLRQVSAVWFLFNGHDTSNERDCYAYVEKVAIRYRDPNGKISIKKLTQNIGDLAYMEGVRGPNKRMFGYMLNNTDQSLVYYDDYRFLGIRLQILLKRGGSGPQNDYLSGGVSGIRLGLGYNPTNSFNTTAKRALVGAGNMTWYDFESMRDQGKMQLETR